MRRLYYSIIICLLLAGFPEAGAQSGQPTPDKFLRKFDQNGDGRVSRQEFKGPASAFGRFDGNGDGFATIEEVEAFFGRRAAATQVATRDAGNDPVAAWYANLPVILTHTHVWPRAKRRKAYDDWDGAIRNALKSMNENGVRAAIVMPTPSPRRNADDSFFDGLNRAVTRYPDRFRVAGGGMSLNGMIEGIEAKHVDDGVRREFIERAEEIIRKGGIGFGETTALHFSFFEGHPFEETPPDHPLYLLLADLAGKHGVPLDIHMEAVAQTWNLPDELRKRGRINPEKVGENITAFERLLAHNRKARIIWVHLGMDNTGHRTPELMRRLFQEHPNLYVSISGAQKYTNSNRLIVSGLGLDPNWRELFVAFPDRIMIGSDMFFQPDQPKQKMPELLGSAVRLVRFPKFLPPDIARKVAFENAQRVFGLDVIDVNDVPLPRPGAAVSASQPLVPETFLSQGDIRRVVIGNTVKFRSLRNGQTMFVYFAENGAALIRSGNGPDRRASKKWYFKEGGVLCRSVGGQNRDHCVQVAAGSDHQDITFILPKKRYPVEVLSGRQLPP